MQAGPEPTPAETGYCGVRWVAAKGKWEVGVECGGKVHLMGFFQSAKEAATAYDAAVLVVGSGAPLNFPDQVWR